MLELAPTALPLLERVRFLSIVSSNLDEFFMVRVAGLMNQLEAGGVALARRPHGGGDAGGAPRARMLEIVRRQDAALARRAPAGARGRGDRRRRPATSSTARERAELDRLYEEEIFPILTPLAVGPGQPFPYVSGLSLSLALLVRTRGRGEWRLGRVKVPESLPRFVPLRRRHAPRPDRGGDRGVPARRSIRAPEIADRAVFRVTRDADFEISDEADDLLEAVESKLKGRRFGDVVRLELDARARATSSPRACSAGSASASEETYRIAGLVDALGALASSRTSTGRS